MTGGFPTEGVEVTTPPRGERRRAVEGLLPGRPGGAEFLTPPADWGGEIRCVFRDPDGHLLEVSEVT